MYQNDTKPKKINLKRSKPKKIITKKSQPAILYQDMHTFKQNAILPASLERLARELIEYLEDNPDCINIKEFLLLKGIKWYNWRDWNNLFPVIKSATEHARDLLGVRREKLGANRTLDSRTMSNSMPIYDDDYKHMEEWRAELRKKESVDHEQEINVYIKDKTTKIDANRQISGVSFKELTAKVKE